MKKLLSIVLCMSVLLSVGLAGVAEETARDAFIDDIIATAKAVFTKADGRLQRAQYASDIYVCKNYTVYLFRQSRDRYRMAEYPDVPLVIPDNLPKAECVDFAYGIVWKDVSAAEGNPFYEAASFKYDESLSADENRQIAREFMMQAERGDFFQMSANYYYGVGAHSMVIMANYDPENKTIRWTDSNMKGEKRKGERYALVQFNEEKEIEWFVDAFCQKTRGATIYRLRDDIIYAN